MTTLSRVMSLLLFLAWALLNQGKMTKLPVFHDDFGYMYTDMSFPSITGGVVIHVVALAISVCIGHALAYAMPASIARRRTEK